jgi:fructose-1,6-bisphosphatase/sedoheptulose 1,7-bisphosphatase-like protein
VVEAAVAAQRQYSRAEEITGDFLAVAFEEAVRMSEDEVKFAGVVVIEW